MTSAATKDGRLAVRMTARQKKTIERAAEAEGRSVTDFSVHALVERAEEVLSDRPVIGATPSQWDEFVRRLDQPAKPVAELVELLHRRSLFEE